MPLLLFLFTLLLFPLPSFAGKAKPFHLHDSSLLLFHATFYAETHWFFYPDDLGTITVKFPYTITNTSTGTSTPGIFSASKYNLTGTGKFYWTFPGLEIGYGRFSADANINYVTAPTNWTSNFYFGLNYRLPAPGFFRKTGGLNLAGVEIPGAHFREQFSKFSVQLCFGIEYYHPLFLLGEVPVNSYEKFSALGYTLPGPKDTMLSRGGQLKVYFQQNTIAFTPALSFSFRPRPWLYIGFRISPMIMISQEGGLRMHYKEGNFKYYDYAPGGYNLHYINLRSDGVEATWNGNAITDTPFRLQGVLLTLRVGVGPVVTK